MKMNKQHKTMETILVVEDREDIADLIKDNLENEGYQSLVASNGERAMQILEEKVVDIIILDLMLPRISGQDLLKKIKSSSKWCSIPVIIESARSDESDIVEGLEAGAEDYITKPFSQKVLLTKIRKIFEKKNQKQSSILNVNDGELIINRDSFEVFRLGIPVSLTNLEYRLLELLVLHESKVLTRDTILDGIWKNESIVIDRVIDVHINSLRKKLQESARFIKTIRGIGYRFTSRLDQL